MPIDRASFFPVPVHDPGSLGRGIRAPRVSPGRGGGGAEQGRVGHARQEAHHQRTGRWEEQQHQ